MSKIAENLRVAITALLTNKFRAFLTTIGIGIGIAAVIVLVSLGQAVQAYVTSQFLSVGSDLIYVQPASAARGGFGGPGGGRGGFGGLSTITENDLKLISDPFNDPNIKNIVPVITVFRPIINGPYNERVSITATTPIYLDLLNRQVASGTGFTDDDVSTAARVALIGQTTANNLFPGGANPIGQTIRVGQVDFKVIGTLVSTGTSSFGANQDDVVIVPITAAQDHLESQRAVTGAIPLNEIILQADSVDNIDDIVNTTTLLVRSNHKIKPGADDDFQVTSQQDIINSLNQTITLLTVFLSVIGGISLIVGGIGVMNIMLVTVTERTREIGLRKAVGARGWDVRLQFLVESLFLCFVGGLGGLLLAIAVTQLIQALVPSLSPSVSVLGVILAVGVTTIIGVTFGFYPANRAASLSPIQALRTE